MNSFANMVLWIYILLLLVGGLIGFLKAGSKVSLITSAVFAAILALATVPGLLGASLERSLPTLALVILLIVFVIRFTQTKKFMPSGLMLILTAVALALYNIRF